MVEEEEMNKAKWLLLVGGINIGWRLGGKGNNY